MTALTEPVRRRRRRERLTDLMVAALPKRDQRYPVLDPEQHGHYIRVMPKGPNVYVAVARDPYGKQVWATVGNADVLKIEEARGRARVAIDRIKRGLAPFPPPPPKKDTFEAVAQNWLGREAGQLRTRSDIERILRRYVLPRWKGLPFEELRRGEVAALLDAVEDKHGKRQADIVLAIVRKIMRWHQARNEGYTCPIVPGMNRYKPKERQRKRILSDDEIQALWTATDEMGAYGALVKVLLLTGQRRAKVTTMRWSDIVNGLWRIPAEDREKTNAGTLRLPQVVLDVVTKQPRFVSSPYVFAAAVGKGPFSSFGRRKAELDAKMREQLPDMEPWVLHDLRRSAKSLMARAGVRPDISERVLGHAIPGVEGVYDVHDYTEEKSMALNQLAALIERIVKRSDSDAGSCGKVDGEPYRIAIRANDPT